MRTKVKATALLLTTSASAIADSMGNPVANAGDGGGLTFGVIVFGTVILVAVWYFFDKK